MGGKARNISESGAEVKGLKGKKRRSIFCGLLTILLLGLSDLRCGVHFLWLTYQSPVGAV